MNIQNSATGAAAVISTVEMAKIIERCVGYGCHDTILAIVIELAKRDTLGCIGYGASDIFGGVMVMPALLGERDSFQVMAIVSERSVGALFDHWKHVQSVSASDPFYLPSDAIPEPARNLAIALVEIEPPRALGEASGLSIAPDEPFVWRGGEM